MTSSLTKTNTRLTKRGSGVAGSSADRYGGVDFLLLDGSGSMSSQWTQVCDSMDAYVYKLKALQVQTHITLAVFDSGNSMRYTQYDAVEPDEWQQSAGNIPLPGGGTPLYAAINQMGLQLAAWDEEEPIPKCCIVIATDGENTDNPEMELQALAVLNWCRAKGWQVIFVGCDFNNLDIAKGLGADNSTAIGTSTRRLKEVMTALADKRKRYDADQDMEFSDDEKSSFGGYLTGPSGQ